MPWNPPATFTSGQLVTAAHMNSIIDALVFVEEIAYTQYTSAVTITATTDATSTQVVSSGAITYENLPHLIEFYAPSASPDSGAATWDIRIGLFDGSTSLGRIASIETPAAVSMQVPVYVPVSITPSVGSHTYNIRAYVDAGTGFLRAGAGGADTLMPGWIRVSRRII